VVGFPKSASLMRLPVIGSESPGKQHWTPGMAQPSEYISAPVMLLPSGDTVPFQTNAHTPNSYRTLAKRTSKRGI
jgi:hypothetical protein